VPLYATRHLPFTDLPEHVATISTLRHWFDASWPDAHIYELSTRGTPYVGYQVLGALLTWCVGDALLANRLILSAIALGIPWATRALVLAFGGDERLALFACGAFWCRALVLGFFPFMAAVPVTLLVLTLVANQVERPTPARGAAIAALALLVFYLHLVPFFLIVATSLGLELVHATGDTASWARRLRRSSARLAWLVPGLVAALIWVARAHTGSPMMGDGSVRYIPAGTLAIEFPAWSQAWGSPIDRIVGTALWGAVLALAWHKRVPDSRRALAMRTIPVLCALASFLLIPFAAGVTAMLNVRVAVFFLPLVALVLRPDRRRLTSAVLLVVASLSLVLSAEATTRVRDADRSEMSGFDGLMARIPPGAPLLTLEFVRTSAYHDFAPWLHAGAYHRLSGGGVASYSFAEVPHWPIHFRPEAQPPRAHALALESDPCAFRNAEDGPYYAYVLVRGGVDPFQSTPPGPRWKLVAREGDWALYEKLPGPEVPARADDPGPCIRDAGSGG
jgi:hypothetical protein